MSVRLNLNEEAGLYELGDDVEGVFIPFVTQTKTAVDSHIASVLAHQEANAATPATPAKAPDAGGEYEDNGDGTYTRESDGAVGTFGPDGFTVKTPA